MLLLNLFQNVARKKTTDLSRLTSENVTSSANNGWHYNVMLHCVVGMALYIMLQYDITVVFFLSRFSSIHACAFLQVPLIESISELHVNFLEQPFLIFIL